MNTINDEIQEISIDGYQVVNGEFFSTSFRQYGPTVTLWYNCISFSKAAFTALNGCERVRIEINPDTRGMLLIPVTKKDKDNIHWIKGVKNPTPRKMECRRFTSQLFQTWGFNPEYVYRASGRIVTPSSKVMLFFDFTKADSWKLGDKSRGKKDV